MYLSLMKVGLNYCNNVGLRALNLLICQVVAFGLQLGIPVLQFTMPDALIPVEGNDTLIVLDDFHLRFKSFHLFGGQVGRSLLCFQAFAQIFDSKQYEQTDSYIAGKVSQS